MQRIVFPLLLVLMTAAPVWAQAAVPAAASEPEPLRLRAGDMVRLQIGGEPDLTGDYPITADGSVLLPLVGLVRVAGRPFDEVRSEVEAAYGGELPSPTLVLVPLLRIAVLGEVRQPGLLPVDPTLTVADVLASAGGLTPVADPGRIMLLRDGGTVRLSLDEPTKLLDHSLRPGDQIVVSRQSWVRENLTVLVGAGASVLAAALTSLILR